MALKHVFHLHRLADFGAIYGKSSCLELGRTSDDSRIARKAEAFTRHENGHVHFTIGVFIMMKGDSVGARIDACKRNAGGGARRHAAAIAFRIFATVGEIFWIGRHADEDIALCAAQALNIDVDCCRTWRSFNRAAERCDSNCRDQGQCRTFYPKT